MRWKKYGGMAVALWLVIESGSGQGLLVDQASGTTDEIVTTSTQLPDNQIAQSFTPALSAVVRAPAWLADGPSRACDRCDRCRRNGPGVGGGTHGCAEPLGIGSG